jgi:DNA repair protein RecN (Recombination protein N)
MLKELLIRNLAVIESVHLEFGEGFHVLTGETGAGKSIIIDALSLIAGSRGSADLVRHGSEKAEMEALFELDADHPVWTSLRELGIKADAGEPLIIRREISAQGKSYARINGQLVNLTMLREIGQWLVNIHGQHEHGSLLKAEEHIRWLDLYGEANIGPAKRQYEALYRDYRSIRTQLEQLKALNQQALQMQDLYRFQAEEIAAADLKIGEDEWLSEERRKLSNAEKLYQSAADAYEMLYGSQKGLDSVRRALQKVQDIAALDGKKLNPILEQLQTAFYQLEDAAFQLRDYREEIEFNPMRLEEIEQRLNLLTTLRRKYGEQISDILDYLASINAELERMENKDEIVRRLEADLPGKERKLAEAASRLSQVRRQVADKLAGELETELRELHMERTRFAVQIRRTEDPHGLEDQGSRWKYGSDGWDLVEFLISPNPGEPLRGLGKIASGGELSRIMLAMKTIFARMDQIPVLVFDEVDTGVSGRAAQAIAEKLSRLSADCQVFSITHLPQVACMADSQYAIRKVVEKNRTFTRVNRLDEEGRREELARMLGGVEVTETTLSHAQEMLSMAKAQKSSK